MTLKRDELLRAAIKAEVRRQLEAQKSGRAMEAFGVGDRVILTRRDSIQHHRAGGLSITGKIVELREDGYNDRNFKIEFDDDFGTGRKLPGTWWAKSEFKRYSGSPDKGKHLNKESVAESAQGLDRRQLQLLQLVKDAGPRGYEVGGFGHPDASALYRAGLVEMGRNERGITVLKITPEGKSYGESVKEEFYHSFRAELVPADGGGLELQALGKGFAIDVVNDSKDAAKKALEQMKQWAKSKGFGAILIGARLGDKIGSRKTIMT